MENHSTMTGCHELFFLYKSFKFLTAVAIATFLDIPLKIYRLPNFNMLFQLLLTEFSKGELFLR